MNSKLKATTVVLLGLMACQLPPLQNKEAQANKYRVRILNAGGQTQLETQVAPGSFTGAGNSENGTAPASGRGATDQKLSYQLELSQAGSNQTLKLPFGPPLGNSDSLPLISASDKKFECRIPVRILVQISDRLLAMEGQNWSNSFELVAQQALSRTFDQATILKLGASRPIEQLRELLRPKKNNSTETAEQTQFIQSLDMGALPELIAEAVLVLDLSDQSPSGNSQQLVARLFDFTFDSYASYGAWERSLIFEEYIEIATPCTSTGLIDAFGEISLSLQNSTRVSHYSSLLNTFRIKNEGRSEFTIRDDELNPFLAELFVIPENASILASGLLGAVPPRLQSSDSTAHKEIEESILFPCPPAPEPIIEAPKQEPSSEGLEQEQADTGEALDSQPVRDELIQSFPDSPVAEETEVERAEPSAKDGSGVEKEGDADSTEIEADPDREEPQS